MLLCLTQFGSRAFLKSVQFVNAVVEVFLEFAPLFLGFLEVFAIEGWVLKLIYNRCFQVLSVL